MERGFLLDVVVGQRPAVLQLLVGEDQPLLDRGDSLLFLKQLKISYITLISDKGNSWRKYDKFRYC